MIGNCGSLSILVKKTAAGSEQHTATVAIEVNMAGTSNLLSQVGGNLLMLPIEVQTLTMFITSPVSEVSLSSLGRLGGCGGRLSRDGQPRGMTGCLC